MTGVGLAQPKTKPPSRRSGEVSQEQAADRVEMGDRVERQPAEHLRRGVAQPVGDEGVGELVDRETDEQEDRDEDDLSGVISSWSTDTSGDGSRVS